MKGQILQIIPSSDYKPSISFARTIPVKSRGRLLYTLLVSASLLIWQSLSAGGLTNTLSRDAEKALSELVSDGSMLVVKPSSTNIVAEDRAVLGPTNITDLEEILNLYAESSGRIVLWPRNLSASKSDFVTNKPLRRREATSALDAFFASKGIGMIDVGERWVKAMSSAGCQTSADFGAQTSYVVHVQQLAYLKPSELIPILQPFSSGVSNAVLPIDSEQILVLRDLPENIKRMREAIREIDVANPGEQSSEVIPVKYAKASEIAGALNTLRTNGVGKSALLERMDKRLRSAGGKFKSTQVKLLADERTNSLLVYAGREDMKRIKEVIFSLDTVAAQILIEAVIIEVNRTNGVAIQAIDDREVSWMTNFFPIAVTNAPPATEPTRAIKEGGKAGFSRFAAITNDLDSFVSILATNNSARILQRPRIQTSDGEPAQLFVGEARPIPDGAYYSGAVTCGSSIQMLSLGVTLELTPSILSDHAIALDIHQTLEEANGSVTIANVGDIPITRRTEQSAKVIVPNGDVILFDGSVERANTPPTLARSKFKRVLTLNGLFHHSKSITNQDELIILIRPTILPTPEAAAQLSKAEKDRMPAVKRTELEIQTEEVKRLKQLEKNLKSEWNPGSR